MEKYRNSEIKTFSFSDLEGTHVVSQTQFQTFDFQNLTGESITSTKVSDVQIREERSFAQKNNFKIDDIVRDCRGLSRQEQNDLEERIQKEVKVRLETAYENAYKEGLEKGFAEGKATALAEFQGQVDQKIEGLEKVITDVQDQTKHIISKNQQEIYSFIKRFTKWIILKEVNEKLYLENLLEKLILEFNSRKNLIIKVGQANFSQMPEVILAVEKKLGQLTNIRVEVVPEINHPGIVLEGENGLIDGSLEGVLANIDKIFEQVVKHE